MTLPFGRCCWLLTALLYAAFAAPAGAATGACGPADPATQAAGKPCAPKARTSAKARGSASRPERIRLAALTQPELAVNPPLTHEEARGALDRELSLKVGKHMRQTDYPDEAQRWGWSGTVLVEVSVTSEGLVDAVALSRTSGYQILDERALEVVRRVPRLFVPVQLRGRPQRAVVPISFHLPSP